MQDKEFDKIFRSQLQDLEVQPTAAVWEGIDGTLNAGKRKKLIVSLLSVAASIVALIIAGVLFIPHSHNVGTKRNYDSRIAKTALQAPTVIPAKKTEPQVVQATAVIASTNIVAVRHGTSKQSDNRISYGVKDDISAPANEKPIQDQTTQVIAAANQKQPEILTAVVPDTATKLSERNITDAQPAFVTKPVINTIAVLPVIAQQNAKPVKAKHKIRTLGDLINLAVAKVDKRPDKFIEFTDTDDDESNITGVNIGIIKIKKEK